MSLLSQDECLFFDHCLLALYSSRISDSEVIIPVFHVICLAISLTGVYMMWWDFKACVEMINAGVGAIQCRINLVEAVFCFLYAVTQSLFKCLLFDRPC